MRGGAAGAGAILTAARWLCESQAGDTPPVRAQYIARDAQASFEVARSEPECQPARRLQRQQGARRNGGPDGMQAKVQIYSKDQTTPLGQRSWAPGGTARQWGSAHDEVSERRSPRWPMGTHDVAPGDSTVNLEV